MPDGNTWWYRVAASPWNNAYYATADGFYNNGSKSGALTGTPFVDTSVPLCDPPASGGGTSGGGGGGTAGGPGVTETAGGVTHTFTDYNSAGGTQGTSVQPGQAVTITCRRTGFAVADGNNWWYQLGDSPWSNSYYASADAFYNNGQTSGSLSGTPFVDTNVPLCASQPAPGGGSPGVNEVTGGVTHTWTDYNSAGGTQGPSIQTNQTVTITCRLNGFTVADGNNWWYRIASSPWSNAYYASADAFYNNGASSGSLSGTPFVDSAVPACPSATPPPPTTWSETTGGVTHTWTDYNSAGGSQGQSINSNQTVQIACRLQGFKVADGNTWWYRIASGPWNSSYYASADAFYNNGQTSGSLSGTPFVDSNVATC